MKIDLRKVPAVYMNLKQHTEKNEQMQSLLKECGFETIIRVEGPYQPDNPPAGCAGAHYVGVSEIDPPFVLFEDDCELHNFKPIIEVPDDADAVYLGTSQWARYWQFSGPFVHYEKVSDEVVRVYNMLGGHSILYLSNDYVRMCQRICYHASEIIGYNQDPGFAEVQKYFNIYSMNDPFFKQSGYNNAVTTCKVTDVGIHISDAQRFFDSVKYDLARLQGVPDLNRAPSTYHPLRIV
jgi:hypothetical protein